MLSRKVYFVLAGSSRGAAKPVDPWPWTAVECGRLVTWFQVPQLWLNRESLHIVMPWIVRLASAEG